MFVLIPSNFHRPFVAVLSSKKIRSVLHFLPNLPFLFLIFLLIPVTCISGRGDRRRSEVHLANAVRRKCEDITIPMCRGVGYNQTSIPNQFLHDSQEEAGLEAHQFWPLVEIQCSTELRFFLCSLYTPICIASYHLPLPPCRSVCVRVRAGCAPLMRQYGFAWPHRMDCNLFPEYGDPERLCMQLNTTYGAEGTSAPMSGSSTAKDGVCPMQCRCNAPFVEIGNGTGAPFDRVSVGEEMNCATPCRGVYFGAEEDLFTEFWIGLWSVACLISTSLTLFTFLIEPSRFRYPERSIVFLSLCYSFVSLAYVIRLVLGHDVIACVQDGAAADNRLVVVRHLRTTRPQPMGACHAIFFLLYFFGMASNVWWVILSFSWFLSAGLKWGEEAVSSCSPHFHLTAWLLPSAQTIAVLATSAVDGDVISGVCYVGNASVISLRLFVIAPLCLYLFCATAFLVAGFVSLVRVRHVIRQQCSSTGTNKLERFMVRIGVFSLLYTLPATCLIACYLYEDTARRLYETHINCRPCADPGRPSDDPGVVSRKPEFAVFMAKYFMSLVVGITSGFWIWTGKTIESWRRFYERLSKDPDEEDRRRQQVVPGRAGGGGAKSSDPVATVSLTQESASRAGGQGGQRVKRWT